MNNHIERRRNKQNPLTLGKRQERTYAVILLGLFILSGFVDSILTNFGL